MNNKFWGCMLAAVAISSCFTSCDEDEKVAMQLSGTWEGKMYSCIEWRTQGSERWHSAEPSMTYLNFVTDHLFGSTQGYGVEVDYFAAPCPVEYFSCVFDWKVRDGNVDLDFGYKYEDMNVTIYDYRLHYGSFKGQVGPKHDEFSFVSSEFDCSPFYYLQDGHRVYPGEIAPSEYCHYRDAQFDEEGTRSEGGDSTQYEVRVVRRRR